jgi:hypothetical protein
MHKLVLLAEQPGTTTSRSKVFVFGQAALASLSS